MYPVGSKAVRNGSRVNTSKDVRGPLAPGGGVTTGFPARSTLAGEANAFPFWTPGKYRKIPRRASAVYTGELILARCNVRCPSYKKKKNVLFFKTGPPMRPTN